MGFTPDKYHEQAQRSWRGHTRTGEEDRNLSVNDVLQASAQLTAGRTSGQAESHEVYDILNAGPQHRFVVLGESGPFIVHNCVQHLARNVIADCALAVARTDIGKRYPLANMVHDELVYVVKEEDAEEMLAVVQEIMRTPPSWWPELVTWSEGDIADTYGTAK